MIIHKYARIKYDLSMITTLRTKFTIALLFGLLTLFFSLQWFWSGQVEKSFHEIEEVDVQTNLNRVVQGLKQEEEELLPNLKDWAHWDAMFLYVTNKNNKFIKENIPVHEDFFVNNDYNLFIIISNKNEILYAHGYSNETQKAKEITKEDTNKVVQIFSEKPEESVKYAWVDNKLMLLAYAQTKNSELTKSAGANIAGIFIDDVYIQKMSKRLQLDIKINPPTKDLDNKIELVSDNKILASNNYFDAQKNNPIFNVEVAVKRPVHQKWLETQKTTALIMSVLIVLNFVGLWLVIDRFAVAPINNLTNWLRSAATEKTWRGKRYFDNTSLEFAVLSESTNKLLDDIDKQASALIQSEKFKSLGEMAGGVAHEINNPLAVISGVVTRLKKQIRQNEGINTPTCEQAEAYIESLTKIESMVQRIVKIVRGLRSFSRNTDEDDFEIININTCILDAIDISAERFKNQGINLLYSPNLEIKAKAKSAQITQVLVNLLNNAYDAIKDEAPTAWVRVDLQATNKNVIIKVVDSGRGIDSNLIEKIMEPFFSTKPVGQGTGLGLSISRGIIEKHDGRIYYDPSASTTTFVIELPIVD